MKQTFRMAEMGEIKNLKELFITREEFEKMGTLFNEADTSAIAFPIERERMKK